MCYIKIVYQIKIYIQFHTQAQLGIYHMLEFLWKLYMVVLGMEPGLEVNRKNLGNSNNSEPK